MRALLIVFLAACWFGSDGARAQSRSNVDWSGFYFGGNLGALTGASDLNAGVRPDTTYFNTGTDSDQVAAAGSGTLRQTRFTGGVVGGYNAQFGNILVGLEVGANVFDFNASRTGADIFLTDPNIHFAVAQTVKSDWIASLRPRLGWAQENWLVYVTGGPAWTRVQFDFAYSDDNAQAGSGLPGASARGSARATKTGWTLGAGGEYALSRNWSLTGQYLFADFGRIHASAPLVPTPTSTSFPPSSAARPTCAPISFWSAPPTGSATPCGPSLERFRLRLEFDALDTVLSSRHLLPGSSAPQNAGAS
jgi:opacity protein-like surface antigen